MKVHRHNLLLSLLLALSVAFAPVAGAVAAIEMMPLKQGAPCHMSETTGKHITGNGNCCDHGACQDNCSHCLDCVSIFVFGPVARPLELDDFHSTQEPSAQAMLTAQAVATLFRPPRQFS